MNTAEYVEKFIKAGKAAGEDLAALTWKTALACEGWAYVFGARGQYCTPAHRRARYNATKAGKNKDNIKDRCKNFDGSGTCSGCQWYPNCKRTRDFDCRGFTYWILLQVYDWELMGAGATSQWNTASNWKAKGKISDGVPADTLVCLFQADGKTMEHTGFGLNNETVECSKNVQHFTNRNKKWTHWAVPACESGDVPTPTPTPETKPTLRRGSTGPYVVECQEDLIKLGYDVGPSGADGIYGKNTETAVKVFQSKHDLKIDGVVGSATWAALDEAVKPTTTLYTVTVKHLTEEQADALIVQYPGSSKKAEGGDAV